jgi:cobalt-zinc-cadmium efflux system outer membrane protein
MRRSLLVLPIVLAAVTTVTARQTRPAPAPRTSQGESEPAITLAEVERMALERNPTLQSAAARLRASRARTDQAGAWPNPMVGFSAEEVGGRDGDPRGEFGFFVEQLIPLGGKLRLSQAVMQRATDRTDADLALQRARVLSSVRRAFYEVATTERRIEVQERLASLVSEAVGITAQLYNVGAADRPDLLEAEVEARRIQLDVTAAKDGLFAARQRLAAVVGDPQIASRPLAVAPDQTAPEIERDAALRQLLDDSPRLRAARADLARTQAVTAAARRETFPDLFVRGGAAYNRELGERSATALGWEGRLEAGVSLPLFNRNTAGAAAARADEQRAQAELQRLDLSLRAQFAGEYAAYLTAVREADTYRTEILPRQEEAYRLYLTKYRTMGAAYPQVLVAQRRLLELSSEYLKRVDSAWQAAVQLQNLLAGDGLQSPGSDGDESENGWRPSAGQGERR